MDDDSGDDDKDDCWQMDEEMNRDNSGEADEMNLKVDSKNEVMHI